MMPEAKQNAAEPKQLFSSSRGDDVGTPRPEWPQPEHARLVEAD
jgi:hypothetical protein